MIDQLPEIPNAEQYEVELLGYLIGRPENIVEVAELLQPNHFSRRHAPLFQVLLKLENEKTQINLTVVVDELRRTGELEKLGGPACIAACVKGIGRLDLKTYIAKIIEADLLRDAQRIASNIVTNASRQRADDVISTLDAFVTRARGDEESLTRSALRLNDIAPEVCRSLDRLSAGDGAMLGISTGYPDLDQKLCGFVSGELICLASRPSVGKTALGLEFAVHAAKAGHHVAIFSLEMRREALFLRMACRWALVPHEDTRGGRLSRDQWSRLVHAVAELSQLPIWIDDRPGVDASHLRWRIRNAGRRHKARVVIVDYLQLLRARGESRYEQVTRVSMELQAAAKELGEISDGTLLALAQLNRLAASDEPELHHLRDSGQIEQDSDSVLMLYDKGKRVIRTFVPKFSTSKNSATDPRA
jgi:replicative DNA helicase